MNKRGLSSVNVALGMLSNRSERRIFYPMVCTGVGEVGARAGLVWHAWFGGEIGLRRDPWFRWSVVSEVGLEWRGGRWGLVCLTRHAPHWTHTHHLQTRHAPRHSLTRRLVSIPLSLVSYLSRLFISCLSGISCLLSVLFCFCLFFFCLSSDCPPVRLPVSIGLCRCLSMSVSLHRVYLW